ncbi:MAG: diheme cytochrome c [Candidatus Accumulibacter sp.]|nr:diheme cytochrome c [Accumulibacter sp.]
MRLYRSMIFGLFVVVASAMLLQIARAGGNYYPPVSDALVKEECGSCHLAFPPSMLPSTSWQRLMGGLKNHFGDDVSLDPASVSRITAYLTAHAGDTGGARYAEKLLRGVSTVDPPLRITELPRWLKEHRKVKNREWQQQEVRSKANCPACHRDAERGYFDE